ncbi:putative ATPase [Triangularia verruculosa]|uniref:ATPase n=1 Tax=Triangularia verruculosa TaxID=2587418 RepID=A0AAN7B0X5_9PEZI|nr:putative ATPase [Triangularia verruculosa]
MAPVERDTPRDLRHQHSASLSDHGRALVPMWDSSDPERAPPPLPLNPQSPIVSRTGTSSAIQSAHAALAEKARENAALVPHVPKHQRLEVSPERPLPIPGMAPAPLIGNSHRRMNSLQPTSVKDMSMMIEAGSSPARDLPVPRSPEKNTRPVTPSRNPRNSWIEPKEKEDYFGNSGDDRSNTVISPKPGPSLTPIIRPTARRATHQSILGENTPPPSATMLALQNMSIQSNIHLPSTNTNLYSSPIGPQVPPPSVEPEKPQPPPPQPHSQPLADITNNSQALVQVAKVPESLDLLSHQILTLTDIATTLQKEMSLLSRRSRDNATDLLSLKEATNARDEDIRKSLRDLITESKARAAHRELYGGPLLLEGRHHTTSPTQLSKTARPFSLPRIPSPNSFAASYDRESMISTPSLVGSEAGTNSTTVTLVEKIIRDMATKEGQESLMHRLSDLANKLSGMATADKIEELVRFIKENQQRAVIPVAGGAGGGGGGNKNRNWDVGEDDDDDDSRSHSSRLLQGGSEGVNEEVYRAIKTVKDSLANAGGLTAEVKALVVKLRGEVLHMGRDLGQKFEELLADGVPGSGSGGDGNKAEMQRIIEQGLAQMSEQMNKILREYRYTGGSGGDVSSEAHALTGPREAHQFDSQELYNAMRAALKDTHPRTPDLRREDVMQAVKDAWEKYKPEIEIQQIGLERDEVLACLEQGLADFKRPMGATREEVFAAVADGLRNYQPPKVEVLRKQDVLEVVTECLSEWEFPAPPKTGDEVTREDMLDAVREGLLSMPPPPEPKGVTRDDVIDAVADALDAFDFSKTVSEALVTQPVTKGDVAEAVSSALKGLDLSDDMLDAVQEGLRGQEEKVQAAVEQGLKAFDLEALAAMIPRPDLSRVDVADAVKEGLEFLDLSRDDVADAVKDGLEKMDLTNTLSKSLAEAVKKVLEDHNFGPSPHAANNERALVPRSASMGTYPMPMSTPPSSAGSEMPATGPSASKADIQEAVKNALDSLDFSLEIADAVKTTLESFDFAAAAGSNSAAKSDLSKGDVVDAVKEGIQALDLSTEIAADVIDLVKKELEQTDSPKSQDPEAIVAAVKRGLQEVDLTTEIAADLIEAVRKEFQTLSSSSAVVAANATTPAVNNEEVIAKLQDIKESMLAELKSVSEEAKKSTADSDGLEKLRAEIESYVDRVKGESSASEDKEEFMQDLLKTLDGFRDDVGELVLKSTDSSKAMLKEELESLREVVNSSMVPVTPQGGMYAQEILSAIQEGLSSLRAEVASRPIAGLNEILDALQEGLGDIRVSINNLRDKPADLTANDEILEALKTGLDSVRADIDDMRKSTSNELALVKKAKDNDEDDIKARAIVPVENTVEKDDIKNLEVLLTQLGKKVEVMQATPVPAADSMSKEDARRMEDTIRQVQESVATMSNQVPLASMEDALKKIQATVNEMSTRDPPFRKPREPRVPSENDEPALREDVEAIETILRNTKARLDDLIDGEQGIRKDHIDALEALILETRESLAGLVSHVDTLSKKDNIDALETLILETRESVGGVASQLEIVSQKEDVLKVESLVNQVVAAFDEMKERHEKALDDPERITKTDVDAVEAVCLDTKVLIESIMKADLASLPTKENVEALELQLGELKECMDFHALDAQKAAEDRQAEIVGVGERVGEVKAILEDFHGVLRGKLEEGAKGVDSIHLLLDGFSTTIREAISKNDTVGDDLKVMLDALKTDVEESKTTFAGANLETSEKVQAASDAVIAKLDERVADLMSKYDEFQLLHEERAAKGEERDANMEAAVVGNKAIAEELKQLVDTLGSAVTDSMERMEEASKTVFERVEALVTKSDESQLEAKTEHSLTRETVQEAITKVGSVNDQVAEYQPKILQTLEDFVAVVGQHYEQLHTKTQAIQERVEIPVEKYDDTAVNEKLDILVGHTEVADKAFERLDTLDEVHTQVKATAAELAVFIAAQTQRIADEHEDKEKTLQETIVALERKLEEKQQVEVQVSDLREEQERLKQYISVTLPQEQEQITIAFMSNLQSEEARLKETISSLKEEQELLKETFLSSLKEEQARITEANVALKAEQDQLKESFIANLKEEQARIMETNVALKEEQDKLKETFLANLREEEGRLKELNDALREEQQNIRDTYLANLREEESLLKEINASLRADQEALRESFIKNFQEEELRLREVNEQLRADNDKLQVTLKEENDLLKAALKEEYEQAKAQLKEEHEQLKAQLKAEQEALKAAFKAEQDELRAAMKEDNDRLKIELLSNLMEEETRVKEANAALRVEHDNLKTAFLAELKEEEERIKTSLADLRLDQEDLNSRKNNLRSELSTLEAACKFRREEVDDLTNQSEHMERKVLEGVMDLSRVLLMKKTASGLPEKKGPTGNREFSSTMSRKRVVSGPNKARGTSAAINIALAQSGISPEARRNFSLTQISNNVPTGGMKRSQSVRTPAGGATARGIRNESWTPSMAGTPKSRAASGNKAGKGYGDLMGDRGLDEEEDKENSPVDDLKEEAEEDIAEVKVEQEPEAVKVEEIYVDESDDEAESVAGDDEPTPAEETGPAVDEESSESEYEEDEEAKEEVEEAPATKAASTRVSSPELEEASSESESESEDEEEVVEAKAEDIAAPATTTTTADDAASEFSDDDIEHVEAESESESESENEKEPEEPTVTQEKLRKVSSGTTVVTPNVEEDGFTSSEESDFDDGASDWTNPPAAMGTETNITALESEVGTPVEEKKKKKEEAKA